MSVGDTTGDVLSREDEYADTPRGWAQRLGMEFDAAQKWHDEWHKKGEEIVNRYLDKRKGEKARDRGKNVTARLNIFTANEQTVAAVMYGNEPEVDVRPRWLDANDEVARIAAEIEERVLNGDIEREEDGFQNTLALCLNDRRLPGVGFLRMRYVAEFDEVEGKEAQLNDAGEEIAPAVEPAEEKSSEEVETVYGHWRDVLWGPCRIFEEMPWCAFRIPLTKQELAKKFGKKVAAKIALDSKKNDAGGDGKKRDPWQRADLWEVWHKEEKAVFFFIKGYPEVLRPVDLDDAEFKPNGGLKDPLGLDGFWPFPKPMMANLTTSEFLPRADYTLCQDLYEEVDRVTARIVQLERAIGAKGVFDKNATPALGRLLEETSENEMIPVPNWSALQEKGGIKAAFELMPLDGLILALDKLREYRRELIELVQQLDGSSDMMRGQSMQPGTTATEAGITAGFASVRMQALQKEFARFASDAQRIRAEIIAKHFEPETILERANMSATFDAQQGQLIQQAIALIKSGKARRRIEVKSDQISISDFAARKQEAVEVIEGIGGFIQKAAPLVQMLPGALPDLLQLLKYALSKTRGAQEVGGIIDAAISRAQSMPAQPQGQQQGPDPKLQEAQLKAQLESQKLQQETQADMQRMKAETQEDAVRQANQTRANIEEARVRDEMKLQSDLKRAQLMPHRPPPGV